MVTVQGPIQFVCFNPQTMYRMVKQAPRGYSV